jgi:predicted patatin/cPLA2 family phospholipase
MRGVVAGGMVTAIQELGLTSCFDTFHGSSAGACAGAYLITDQARLGTSIFYEDINNTKVTNPRRLWRGAPIMYTGFITDNVMRTTKRLDVDKIIQSPDLLHIIATTTEAQETHYSRYRTPDRRGHIRHRQRQGTCRRRHGPANPFPIGGSEGRYARSDPVDAAGSRA